MQCILDGGAADRFQVFHEIQRLGDVLFRCRPQFTEERLALGREANDLEMVGFVEIIQAEARRCLLRLPIPPAEHRSRSIQDEADILLLNDALGGFQAGRRQQHEISIVASLSIREQIVTLPPPAFDREKISLKSVSGRKFFASHPRHRVCPPSRRISTLLVGL